jgi:hypothetical protein
MRRLLAEQFLQAKDNPYDVIGCEKKRSVCFRGISA